VLLRLIGVLLALLAASIVVRAFRALFSGRAFSGVRGPRRPALDPEKRVSATWSEVSPEREGREADPS
jgi:hypothetical protein